MKAGYIPAVGTPLDANGNLCVESYKKQIEDQIAAGAVAILSMGSMGIQPYMRNSVCPQVAKAAVEAVAGRVPVFVGAMDCSIARAKERMAAMEDLDIAAFVLTTPYYYKCTRQQIINYYQAVCAATKHPVLMYDLVGVTQSKITYDIVKELLRTVPNLAGIKSADLNMFRKLKLDPEVPEDFLMVYSGLDNFDIAYKWGIDKCLDGMPACTPVNSGKLFAAMENNDYDKAAEYLNNIIDLRDFFVARDLWPSFSTAMNMLGYEGNFAPDYISSIQEKYIPEIREELIRIGEL
ncbi:MAG: dihydrodipicolinate synthase family protein [Ruminococcaceae bacterium]|nr:dihydrodipicolinate synthase family protein [Oscillospiraceae bacterium]